MALERQRESTRACSGEQEAGLLCGKAQITARFRGGPGIVFPFPGTAFADVTAEEGGRGGQVRTVKVDSGRLGRGAVTEQRITVFHRFSFFF